MNLCIKRLIPLIGLLLIILVTLFIAVGWVITSGLLIISLLMAVIFVKLRRCKDG
jgi:hypothetical protein